MLPKPDETRIRTLGECKIDSPLPLSTVVGDRLANFVPDEARAVLEPTIGLGERGQDVFFELAGPRRKIFFNPADVRAAVVTCGGLCPGLNNVIRSIVLEMHYHYGVADILGVRYGFRGLTADSPVDPVALTPEFVEDIHREGGTVLGTSRGPQSTGAMVDFLAARGINALFCIGGDGTQRGAHDIAVEIERRNLSVAVVGVPKTIDNDIPFVSRTFGFETAVEQARRVVDCAHTESKGVRNGVVVVKLMGRQAGFIAAAATTASQDVNFVLVPEVPFDLDGPGGFLAALKRRVLRRHHAVVVVAEGAGQDLVHGEAVRRDASGNVVLADIGIYLRDRIRAYFDRQGLEATVRYIDPGYIIRSVPASAEDSVLCDQFGRFAVHAAMAGKTDVLMGLLHATVIHVPIALAVRERKRLDTEGTLWRAALAATGQPHRFVAQAEPAKQTERWEG